MKKITKKNHKNQFFNNFSKHMMFLFSFLFNIIVISIFLLFSYLEIVLIFMDISERSNGIFYRFLILLLFLMINKFFIKNLFNDIINHFIFKNDSNNKFIIYLKMIILQKILGKYVKNFINLLKEEHSIVIDDNVNVEKMFFFVIKKHDEKLNICVYTNINDFYILNNEIFITSKYLQNLDIEIDTIHYTNYSNIYDIIHKEMVIKEENVIFNRNNYAYVKENI